MLGLKRGHGFCDLNIPATDNVKEVVLEALKLGYQTIAINQCVSDTPPEDSKKSKKGKDAVNVVPPPMKITLTAKDLQRYKITREPVILSRITISYSNPSEPFLLKNADIIKQYDLIALTPENEAVLKQILLSKVLDVDILSIDNTNSNFLMPSRSLIGLAIEKDIYFELSYSPCIRDATGRKLMINLSHNLYRRNKSRNVLITSQALSPYQVRYPYDVINVGRILGLSELAAKNAISYTAHNAIYCATIRRKSIAKCGAEVVLKCPEDHKYEGLEDAQNFLMDDKGEHDIVNKNKEISLFYTEDGKGNKRKRKKTRQGKKKMKK